MNFNCSPNNIVGEFFVCHGIVTTEDTETTQAKEKAIGSSIDRVYYPIT